MSTSTPDTEQDPTLLVSRELVAGVVMMAVAAFFLLNAGVGTQLDWLFPRVLSYALGFMGLCVVGRGLLGFGDKMPLVPLLLRGQGVDVALFTVMAIAYVVLLQYIGFWVSTALMIFGASVYLDTHRSRRGMIASAVVAAVACVIGYLILTGVFYIFFPEGFAI